MLNKMFKRAALKAAPLLSLPLFASTAAANATAGIPDPSEGFEHLWHHVHLDLIALGVPFALVALYFCLKYIRTADRQNGEYVVPSRFKAFGWILIPVFIFMADDFYLAANGWALFNDQRTVPENAHEVKVTASMWNFNYQYENGFESDNVLVVEENTPQVMRMTSDDVIHNHYADRYRIAEDMMPGRITWQWFLPKTKDIGKLSVISCREYCGLEHSIMHGKVVVLSSADYAAAMADEDAFAEIVDPISDVVDAIKSYSRGEEDSVVNTDMSNGKSF